MKLKHITMAGIKALHLERKPGSPWFNKGATAFFNSVYPAYGYDLSSGIYFVTGERYDSEGPLQYTIRKLAANGDIITVEGFNTHPNARSAAARIKQLAFQ